MSTSTATVNPSNIPLSPMRVTFNGVDLGGTTDSVAVNIKYDLADIMVDQYGKTSLNKKVAGQEIHVKFVLAEVKYKPNWAVAFPHAHLVTSGGNTMEYFNVATGDDLLSKAQKLILHPLEAVDADLSEDYTFFKAAALSASEVKYGPDKQTGLSVDMIIFPDTAASPARFMTYGDPSIGLVAASASGATAAGGNTGNGTISSIVAYSGVTVDETITVACVGQTSGNDFSVVGSVSGTIGVFHIAAANLSTANFVASKISFTMTQGSTQFVYGDSFSIDTLASNYV